MPDVDQQWTLPPGHPNPVYVPISRKSNTITGSGLTRMQHIGRSIGHRPRHSEISVKAVAHENVSLRVDAVMVDGWFAAGQKRQSMRGRHIRLLMRSVRAKQLHTLPV